MEEFLERKQSGEFDNVKSLTELLKEEKVAIEKKLKALNNLLKIYREPTKSRKAYYREYYFLNKNKLKKQALEWQRNHPKWKSEQNKKYRDKKKSEQNKKYRDKKKSTKDNEL